MSARMSTGFVVFFATKRLSGAAALLLGRQRSVDNSRGGRYSVSAVGGGNQKGAK